MRRSSFAAPSAAAVLLILQLALASIVSMPPLGTVILGGMTVVTAYLLLALLRSIRRSASQSESTAEPQRQPAAQDEARINEAALRLLSGNIPGVLYVYDFEPPGQRRTQFIGPGLESLLGADGAREAHANLDTIFDRLHPDDAARIATEAHSALQTGRIVDQECRIRADDDSYRWIRSIARGVDLGEGRSRWFVVLVDVTHRHVVEAALEASEARYGRLIERLGVVAYTFDRDEMRFVVVSPHAEQLLAFPIDAWKRPRFWFEHLHPEDRESTTAKARELAAKGQDHELEYRMMTADGRAVWIRDIVSMETDTDDRPDRLLHGVLIDITRQRRAEQVLRQIVEGTAATGQEFLDSLARSLGLALEVRLAFVGELVEGERVRVRASYDSTGRGMPDEYDLQGTPCEQLLREDLCFHRTAVAVQFPDDIDLVSMNAQAYLGAVLRGADGTPIGVLAVIHDQPLNEDVEPTAILRAFADRAAAELDRLRSEHALRENERRLSELMRNLPGVVYRCRNDPDWTPEYLSEGIGLITGYTAQEFHDLDIRFGRDLIHPDDRKRVWDEVQEALRERRRFQVNYRIVDRAGRERWLWEQGAGVEVDGEVSSLEGFIVDITDQRRAEESLREHESRLRLVVSQTPAVVWTTDRELRYTSSNGAGLVALGLSPNEVVGMSLYEYFGTDDSTFKPIAKHLAALKGESSDYAIEHRGAHFHTRIEPLHNTAGAIIGTIGVAHEISALKRNEESLRAARERERMLFQELDHRVRNNLSSLASLVDLTARSASTKEAFAETIRARIGAMAEVHSLLSRGSGEPLDLHTLILRLTPSHVRDGVELEGPTVAVPRHRATALAMIINELVMNSIKHGGLGTPGGRARCTWYIGLVEGDGPRMIDVVLRWRETGAAPPSADAPHGTGFTLIEGIVRSDLRGRLRLNLSDSGADHEIRFMLEACESSSDDLLRPTDASMDMS